MSPRKPLPYQSEWTMPLLTEYASAIEQTAHDFGLDTYPYQIELINAEQMMAAYTATGLPLIYNHWSFGKQFIELEKHYRRGDINLAYEIVINANPCQAYLMAQSTLTMQALVIAHACFGHNSFFKNNHTFQQWSDPETIVDYLVWAKAKISEHEKKHGVDAVEEIIDACHALKHYGVDRCHKPGPLSLKEEQAQLQAHERFVASRAHALWVSANQPHQQAALTVERFPESPDENMLRFVEENALHLAPWQREIIHIIRLLAQYFYPQRQTKVMNEGWASFWHYTLLQAMYDDGWLTDEFMLQFIQYHSQVIQQLPYDHPQYNGVNPYSLGYEIFSDIKRICQSPTDEDRQWFPNLVNTDWQSSLNFAMRNFKDESFVAQYCSPHLIRELRLFSVLDNSAQQDLEISAIHNSAGYQHLRETLSNQYSLAINEPNIQVYHADLQGDQSLTLRHYPHQGQPLSDDAIQVLAHLHTLWGQPVHCESVTEAGSIIATLSYPVAEEQTKAA